MALHLQMTERQEELFKIFRMAITTEQAAQKMYQEAEAICDDEDIRTILKAFINEESSHEDILLEMYRGFSVKFGIEQ